MIDAPRSETCRGDRPLVQNAPRVLGLLRRGPQAGASADWPKRSVQASPEARLGGRVVMRAAPHCLTAHLQLVLVSACSGASRTRSSRQAGTGSATPFLERRRRSTTPPTSASVGLHPPSTGRGLVGARAASAGHSVRVAMPGESGLPGVCFRNTRSRRV